MEFKLSLSNIIKSNCPRTICSFLNAKGGYIVFGIEDKQRRIVGINADSAELDEYLKWFDSFYHTKRITDSKGNPLHPGTLEPRIVTVSPAKYIVVLAIRPRPNTAYKCQDGTAWHRLGASVYSFQEGATEKELMALKDDLRNEKEKHAIALSRISCLRTDMRRIVGAAKDVDDQLDKFAKAVSHDILTRKAKMELYLMKQNNWLSYLFCNC